MRQETEQRKLSAAVGGRITGQSVRAGHPCDPLMSDRLVLNTILFGRPSCPTVQLSPSCLFGCAFVVRWRESGISRESGETLQPGGEALSCGRFVSRQTGRSRQPHRTLASRNAIYATQLQTRSCVFHRSLGSPPLARVMALGSAPVASALVPPWKVRHCVRRLVVPPLASQEKAGSTSTRGAQRTCLSPVSHPASLCCPMPWCTTGVRRRAGRPRVRGSRVAGTVGPMAPGPGLCHQQQQQQRRVGPRSVGPLAAWTELP